MTKVVELFPETPEAIRRQEANVIAQAIFDQRCDDAKHKLKDIQDALIWLLQQDKSVLSEADYEVDIGTLIDALRRINHEASFGGRL